MSAELLYRVGCFLLACAFYLATGKIWTFIATIGFFLIIEGFAKGLLDDIDD